ncbi:MAG: nucleotidyltransferase family protein [Gammaproteobacteria bacterium]
MNRQQVLSVIGGRSAEIRQRFGVSRLSVFGSAARDEMRDDSDIDILVAFSRPATLDAYMDLKFFLESLLGTSVDLITEKGLRKEIRGIVEKEAVRVA